MGLRLRRSAGAPSGSLEQPVEEWPFLDQQLLVTSRSRKVCMTCHWFRHHSGVNCIPLLTCQLHQGLLAQGEHLTHRCQGWTDDMVRQRSEVLARGADRFLHSFNGQLNQQANILQERTFWHIPETERYAPAQHGDGNHGGEVDLVACDKRSDHSCARMAWPVATCP